jgi:hypothetical protein
VDENATNFQQRLRDLDRDGEVVVLNNILTRGYDQGCFLRPKDADLIPNTPAVTDAVLSTLDDRDIAVEPTADDPFGEQRLAASPIPETDPGYIILTQGCDLIRGFGAEPVVELAQVTLAKDPDGIMAAKRNSPRFIYIADGPKGTAWIVDLRRQARLAKDKLPDYDVVQTIADDAQYKRFKMRVGNRYSRDALPTDLVDRVQKPLRDLLKSKNALRKKAGVFSDFLVFRRDDQIRILPVIADGKDQRYAEDVWDEILEAMSEDLASLIHDDSNPMPIQQVNWWSYTTGWKMDLDDLSYGGKAVKQAPPTGAGPAPDPGA